MGAFVTGGSVASLAAVLIFFAALKLVFGTLEFVVGILALPFGQ